MSRGPIDGNPISPPTTLLSPRLTYGDLIILSSNYALPDASREGLEALPEVGKVLLPFLEQGPVISGTHGQERDEDVEALARGRPTCERDRERKGRVSERKGNCLN